MCLVQVCDDRCVFVYVLLILAPFCKRVHVSGTPDGGHSREEEKREHPLYKGLSPKSAPLALYVCLFVYCLSVYETMSD